MENGSPRDFGGPLSLGERRTCKTPPEVQGASCAPGGQRQRRRRIQSSSRRAWCFSVSDGSGKVLAWYGWRNKWRNFSVHSSQNDRSSQIVTIAERRMSWNPPRQRPKDWDHIEDPVVPLERNLNVHHWPALSRERKVEDVMLEKRKGERTNLGMSSRAQEARIILIALCGCYAVSWNWWGLVVGDATCCHGMSALLSPWTGRDSKVVLCRNWGWKLSTCCFVLAFVLRGVKLFLPSLRSNRRTSTCEVSLRWSIVACVYKHRKNNKWRSNAIDRSKCT